MPGLSGFAEKSEPEGWDLGLGTVVGYRTWEFRRHSPYCRLGVGYRYATPGDVASLVYSGRWPGPGCGCPPGLRGKWGQQWSSAQLTATCASETYRFRCNRVLDRPDLCGCGVWAYWQLPAGQPFLVRPGNFTPTEWAVAGRVEGSGRVVVGEKGFRCEKARITDLCVQRETPAAVIAELEATFQVPVIKARRGFGPFQNPVSYTIHKKTDADPVYGPKPDASSLLRKTIRVITGF